MEEVKEEEDEKEENKVEGQGLVIKEEWRRTSILPLLYSPYHRSEE